MYTRKIPELSLFTKEKSLISNAKDSMGEGAAEPEHVSVFTNPLNAYQTVFCKSLRLIGDKLGAAVSISVATT